MCIRDRLSKVFERLLHKQISNHFDNIFSDNQCGFRKGFNTQDCLLSLVEAWKTANDEKKTFGALLIDQEKVKGLVHENFKFCFKNQEKVKGLVHENFEFCLKNQEKVKGLVHENFKFCFKNQEKVKG